MKHIPVLKNEVLKFLAPKKGVFVDATVGLGGHTKAILKKCSNCRVIGLDWDCESLKKAKKNLAEFGERVKLVCRNFAQIDEVLSELKIKKVQGILADLGISSWQLETDRGFSFLKNAPLDMRISPELKITAAQILNTASFGNLMMIFKTLAESPFARQVARTILEERKKKKIETVDDFLKILEKAVPLKIRVRSKKHFATNFFRALRMAVNFELENLILFLKKAPSFLAIGGRLVVISFHSLEDRLVKHRFKKLAKTEKFKILTKKPIRPTEKEIEKNPRSRSAKMRAIEKIA